LYNFILVIFIPSIFLIASVETKYSNIKQCNQAIGVVTVYLLRDVFKCNTM